MDMNATDMLYEKMAYELAYGDMMAYGPAQLTSPMSERFGGTDFVGYEQHGVNKISFEQGATLHGTRYSDSGSSPLPSDIAPDGLKTLKSPSDLVQRMNYGQADVAYKSNSGSGHIGRATFGSDDLTKAHSGPGEGTKTQMGLGDMGKSGNFGLGGMSTRKEGGQLGQNKEGEQQVRKGKEKPLCSICGQVTHIVLLSLSLLCNHNNHLFL